MQLNEEEREELKLAEKKSEAHRKRQMDRRKTVILDRIELGNIIRS